MPDAQIVVGLGNPPPDYRDTRHNMGQAVIDHLARRLGVSMRRQGAALVGETPFAGAPLYLATVASYMNAVGPPVARLLEGLGLDTGRLIVVYDDIDLPFGRVRARHQGRSGGHNGVRSLIEALGTETFRRVKVGVGRPATRDEVVDWVLSPFTAEEQAALAGTLDRAADLVLELLARGQGGVTVL